MSRLRLAAALFTALSVASSLPSDDMGPGDIYLQPENDSMQVHYDGLLYHLTPDDIEALSNPDGGNWTRPDAMPNFVIDDGVTLIFNGGNDTLLDKRSGNRALTAYNGWNCAASAIVNNWNFGCGTGCITVNSNSVAYSVSVYQSGTGGPHPTASMWQWGTVKGTYN
ncbi:hypothetical protein NQ176_g1067 [Zarea fungicola]|uniref:Uncharacterized protein n=1 Tax=Zarea fungicola TaxID=93591 RepID=A0ACC1NUE2_9HYPO|nr:hypothetical protein NQ176_g1067 [Lecanicillium fungicola]